MLHGAVWTRRWQRSNDSASNSKRRCALSSAKLHRSPRVTQNPIPSGPAESVGLSMARERRGLFRRGWIKKSRCRCPKTPCAAGPRSSTRTPSHSFKKTLCVRQSCADSTSRLATVPVANATCKVAIRCKTSDALGAAQVQFGPEALSMVAHLNKEMGISHERAARVLGFGYGLQTSRSGLCRGLKRLGQKAAPTYEQLRIAVA